MRAAPGRVGSRGQEAWALAVSLGGLVPPPSPECPRQEQDIAFLIDGSGSISATNFAKMLNFVKAMMRQFQRPSSQVCLRGGKERAQPPPRPPLPGGSLWEEPQGSGVLARPPALCGSPSSPWCSSPTSSRCTSLSKPSQPAQTH